jgi:hypothetical protein
MILSRATAFSKNLVCATPSDPVDTCRSSIGRETQPVAVVDAGSRKPNRHIVTQT